MQGIITKITRFVMHDGPGIRTIMFFKGCPLRCKWCSSPETYNPFPEITYNQEGCSKCGKCADVCPKGAITLKEDGVYTDRTLCAGCGTCAESCPNDARRLSGRLITVEEAFFEVESDILFYQNSGGGVTLSGGEAMMQPEFCLELLKRCYKQNISAVIESCLYTNWEHLEKILKNLDLIYSDIKCMDARKHEEFTGSTNQLILDNVLKVDQCGLPMIIRVPVVPGYTDDEENIRDISEFVLRLTNVNRIELLPYHRFGLSEYKRLGRSYELEYVKSPSDESLLRLKKIVESYGLIAQIGG